VDATVIGYDPGGNGSHGLAFLTVAGPSVLNVECMTCEDAGEVIERIEKRRQDPVAIGIDTLTCWNSGPAGWRSADRWLRERYETIQKSVVSSNSMSGAMCVNGMAVLLDLKNRCPELHISETHPKVLYHALTQEEETYDFDQNRLPMIEKLTAVLDLDGSLDDDAVANDHEWDAAISAFAAWKGWTGAWTLDLHALPSEMRLQGADRPTDDRCEPVGTTHFWWPHRDLQEAGTREETSLPISP